MKVVICGYGGIAKIKRDSNLKLLSNLVRNLSDAYDNALKISDTVEFVYEHNLVRNDEQIDNLT